MHRFAPALRWPLGVLLLAGAVTARAEILAETRVGFVPAISANYEFTVSEDSAVDLQGNIYHVGHHNAAGNGMNRHDVVVWRINANGTDGGIWTFGGSGRDVGLDVAIDNAGFVYITGETWSTDFPVKNALQAVKSADEHSDAFIVKLNWDAGPGVEWATYLGGPGGHDVGRGIDVRGDGSVVLLAGQTSSASFPTTSGAPQSVLSGPSDAFVARVSGAGALLAATYLGGSGEDAAHAVVGRGALEMAVGETAGGVPGARNVFAGGSLDAFVAAWPSSGPLDPTNAFPGILYHGGSGRDVAYGIADGHLNMLSMVRFVVGATTSPDLPHANRRGNDLGTSHQRTLGGGSDGFLAAWTSGNELVYSTYLGGPDWDAAYDVVHGSGVTVVGVGATSFPTKRALHKGGGTALGDAFVAHFEKDRPMEDDTGLALRYASLLGEPLADVGTGVTVGASVHVAAYRAAVDFDNGRMLAYKIIDSVRSEQTLAEFDGPWSTSSAATYSGGTAASSSSAGARAVLRFHGTAFAWIGTRGPASGIALVSVDGGAAQRVDLYDHRSLPDVPLFQTVGLPAGEHTVTIEVTGEAHSSSTGAAVSVDAFELVGTPITSPPPAWSRIEQDDSRVARAGGPWYPHVSDVHSGGSAILAMEAGSGVSLSFTGSGIRWLGVKDPWSGIARVYLDDAMQSEIDTYSADERTRVVVFERTWGTSGAHTIRIEATGTRSAAASGAWVWADAFEVLSVGGLPTPTPTATPTPTPSPTPTAPPSPTATPARTRIEENEIPTAGWSTHTHSVHSGGSAITAVDAGYSVGFTFSGTGVRWIGLKDPWSGIARVYLDGPAVAEIDTYSATEQAQIVLYAISGLSPGTHTLNIVVTGTRNPASANNSIWIDAFDVDTGESGPGPTPTSTPPPSATRRVEDNHVATSDTWITHAHPIHSGGSAKISTHPGSGVQYTFTGTGIRWIGLKDPWCGIARVEIDGVVVGDVDTYGATEQAQVPLYTKTDLPYGTHTIEIVVRSERHPASGNTAIWLDAFDVVGGP